MHHAITRLLTEMLMLATILLISTQGAVAALVISEVPLEMNTADVPLWQLDIGRLGIRRCGDCPVTWLRVDDATRFEVAPGGQVQRGEFVGRAGDPDGRTGMITLFLKPDSEYVLRLRLSPSRSR